MGRKFRGYTVALTTYVSPEVAEAIAKEAGGMSVAAWLREVINESMNRAELDDALKRKEAIDAVNQWHNKEATQ